MQANHHRTGTSPLHHLSTRSLAALALSLTTITAVAEVDDELDTLVVSAIRTPLDIGNSTAAVSTLDLGDLERRGIISLREALNEVPGVISTSTSGQAGAIGSLFIRGTTTAYSQVVVDGIRLSDATVQLGNFLGGAGVDDLGRIEVLRGPQAAFYGGEAVGGVIWLETARGSGSPAGRLTVEAGSHDSFRASASHRGSHGNLAWFVGASHELTDNDARFNHYDQTRAALRTEWTSGDWTTGVTFRGTDSRYENPYTFAPSIDHLDSTLATVYTEGRFSPGWYARFTGGFYREQYDSDSAFGNYGTDLDRYALSTDHAIELSPCHRLLAGASWENTDYANTIGTDVARDRYGAYAGLEWSPLDQLTTHAVVRWEDYEAYGDEVTWRAAAAWTHPTSGTTVRGGVGRAFRTPTYLDLFGSSFGAGNPNLKAEDGIGWDLGVEQTFGNSRASLTWFETNIDDRIRSSPAPPVNLSGSTPARGLEAAAETQWADGEWTLRLSWTWLDKSLQDLPDNSGNASLVWSPDPKWSIGLGATYVGSRSWGGRPLDDYLLVRLHGRYRINDHVELFARAENLLNEDYELSGFAFSPTIPGQGAGVFGGITLDW